MKWGRILVDYVLVMGGWIMSPLSFPAQKVSSLKLKCTAQPGARQRIVTVSFRVEPENCISGRPQWSRKNNPHYLIPRFTIP
jgi:hypothetical protein